jgi:hypothetical protein
MLRQEQESRNHHEQLPDNDLIDAVKNQYR